MELFGGILLALPVTIYVASLICRLSLQRGRRPRWSYTVVSGIFGTFIGLLTTFRTDLFRPQTWDRGGKVTVGAEIIIAGVVTLVLTSYVALFIVALYRRRYSAHAHTT
jgi:hypothetical protein